MAQPDRHLGLPQKPRLERLVVGELRPHHLDDAHLVQQPVSDFVDGAHAAFPDLLEKFVLTLELLQRSGQAPMLPVSIQTMHPRCGCQLQAVQYLRNFRLLPSRDYGAAAFVRSIVLGGTLVR